MRSRGRWGWPEALTAALLLAVVWTVYSLAPITWVYDSEHTLLVSEQICAEGNLELDSYFPELQPANKPGDVRVGELSDYRLHWIDGHLYYLYPPGSSVLSAPLVPILRLLGYSSIGSDGRRSLQNETDQQKLLAVLLTSLFVLLVFALAHYVLPLRWSTFTALAMAFGTMALSTASRALWAHTWGILLLCAAIWICWRRTPREWTPLALASVATLLSWCYLVRPTFALSAAGITAFAALTQVRRWWILPAVGLSWLAAFSAYSWTHWGAWIPSYFAGHGLQVEGLAESLAGTLVSPSRGLLVFTPGILCWIYFVAAYARFVSRHSWLALAAILLGAHWVTVSANHMWWGGHAFGPRLMTDVLPWLAVFGIVATRAWLNGQQSARCRRVELGVLLVLWGASAAIHSTGAMSYRAQEWNPRPVNVDLNPDRLWDWSDPQFLRPIRTRVPFALEGDVSEISITAGGTQNLHLTAGEEHAHRSYWILGSTTGTAPGVTLRSQMKPIEIPIRPDAWTNYTILCANTAFLSNTKGILDASGSARASINVPRSRFPGAIGLTLHHAYVVYEHNKNNDNDNDNNNDNDNKINDNKIFYMASNPVPLHLVK